MDKRKMETAFPAHPERHAFSGMTLRDYFAGQALVALINHDGAADCLPSEIASDAYIYADAMLDAREET